MGKQRNVLFIVIDQLRRDCLTGALAEAAHLTNLKALMQESVYFDRNFTVTNPCGPSRASLLTGQYAMNHRSVRNGTPLGHDIPNIATCVRKSGLLPLLFGYTDTSQDPRVFPTGDPALKSYENALSGFHEAVEMRMAMSHPWRSHLLSKGYQFENYEDVFKPMPANARAPEISDPAIYKAEDSDTAFLTDSFLHAMSARTKESWFAHLTYIRPHPPLVAPEPYNKMYDPKTLPLPQRLERAQHEKDVHPFVAPAFDNFNVSNWVTGVPDLEMTDETIQGMRAIYLGLASEVDHHIGRVVQFLKDSGQYENTLLVVTADHGEMLGDRHAWGKMTFYDAAYSTPLIIRDPDRASAAGTKVDAPTESIDIMPTILEWMELPVPSSGDGRSLLPFLSDSEVTGWRDYSFSELDFANPVSPTVWQRALGTNQSDSNLCILREDRFTLVHFNADLPPLLFDHAGKGEFENLADKADSQPELLRLAQKLLSHRMRNADQTLSTTQITNDGPVVGIRR